MNLQELKDRLEKNKLGKYFADLQPLVRNTIRLYQHAADENAIAIGQTKIGGQPDLPGEIAWVSETNIIETEEKKFLIFNTKKEESITKSLSFIAQINLAETAPFDIENLLPKSGLLYFFTRLNKRLGALTTKTRTNLK